MAAIALVVFREVLEAALIISIVLAATKGVAHRGRWVLAGVGGGLLFAVVVAIFAGALSDLAEGMGQEIFNAGVLLAAVAMLAWHNIWMASHARELTAKLNKVGASVSEGELPLTALALVICLAVLREGSEVVLFLYGMAAAAGSTGAVVMGCLTGLIAGGAVGSALYFGLLRIPVRHLFQVTGWLILLLAAGMASQAVRFLVQSDVLPSLSYGPVWDSSWLISDSSVIGQTLHVLIGYTAQPLGVQLLAYAATLIVIGGLMFLVKSQTKTTRILPALAIGATAISVLLSGAPQAEAGDKVYSPIVDGGEFELELTGHRTESGEQEHKWEVGYGFTNYWYSAVYLETEKEPGEDLVAEAFAWENIFQLTEQGEHWVDVGLYLEYEHHLDSGGHDKFETKLLFEKQVGEFVNRLNVIFEKEVSGPNVDGWELGYAWQSKYRLSQRAEIGIEGFGEFGEISDFEPSDEQEHTIGPVISGEMPVNRDWKFKYEVGYQFGLTDAVEDDRAKFILEFETYF